MAKKENSKMDDMERLEKRLPISSNDISYPTGFFGFDCQNGHRTYNETTGKFEYKMGIIDGSLVGVMGRTNCGKSTFCMQLAGNLVRPFEEGRIIHVDLEQGCSGDSRNMMLLKMNKENYIKKYTRWNGNVSIEAFEKIIDDEIERKISMKDQLIYDTGFKDVSGNPIKKFAPTVIILDSFSFLVPEKILDSDESNTDAMTTAKSISGMLKRAIQRFKAYNIICLIIVHIRPAVNLSFIPKKSSMPGLKQDEEITGSTALKYTLSYLLRLDDLTPKFKDGEEFGIDGCYVKLVASKTRQGKLANETKLYFNPEMGYIDYLSNFTMLREAEWISQSGAYFTMDGYDKKFTKKQIIPLYNEDAEFRNTLNGMIAKYISEKTALYSDHDEDGYVDYAQSILSLL